MASFGTGEDIAKQDVRAFKFIDVVGEEPCNTVRRALSPARLHIVNLVAQDPLERRGQFAGKVLEELREVRLPPRARMIAAADEEQKQECVRRDSARSTNAQGLTEAGRVFSGRDPAQSVSMERRAAPEVPAG